jgi:hypothetical protein
MPGYLGSGEVTNPFLPRFHLDVPGRRTFAGEIFQPLGDDTVGDESAGKDSAAEPRTDRVLVVEPAAGSRA